MNKELYLAHQVVAMEADNALIPAMELFGRVGPALRHGFNDVLDKLNSFFTLQRAIPLSNEHKKARDSLSRMNYASILDVPMPVPEGFKGDLAGYADYLSSCLDILAGTNKALGETAKALAVAVSSPDQPMESITADYIKSLAKSKDEAVSGADQYLDAHSSSASVPFGKLVKRNNDWAEVITSADKLKQSLATLDKKDTITKANEVDRLLDRVITQHTKGIRKEVDSQWIRSLSESVYQLAVLLEFYSVTYYRALAYLQSVEDISKKLIEMGKEDQ